MQAQDAVPFTRTEIEAELATARPRAAFRSPRLEQAYAAERRARSRVFNRVTLAVMGVCFDLFILGERASAPEVVPLSAWLRFALFTPALAAFLWADWRRALGRWREPLTSALLIAPTAISGLESLVATSPAITTTYHATPLLQLALLTCRMGLLQTAITNGVCVAIYFAIVLTGPFVTPAEIPSLLLTDAAIYVATLVFAYRLDWRDRQVFLLQLQSEIDRAALAAQNRALAQLAERDALTGLGNRRCFDAALLHTWSDPRQLRQPVTLILFDIDHFKQFNDAYGHQAGDECLAEIAKTVLRGSGATREQLVRYGGEEFAVLLRGTQLPEGIAVANRIREAVAACNIQHPQVGPGACVTISAGVATGMPCEHTAALLIEAADRCLYAAKREGRNRVTGMDLRVTQVTVPGVT